MAFEELKDFLDPDLHIPFRGKVYTIPAASFEDGLYLQEMFTVGARAYQGATPTDADKSKLEGDDELVFYHRALSPELFETLKADGVPFSVIKHMAGTAMMECVLGREEAEAFWASEGKAPKPNRAERRTATRTRTGAGTTTRKPGSATTTSTRKKQKATPGGTS